MKKLLKNYLKTHKLTQAALAAQLGVNPSLVNHWLSGLRKPSIKSIKALNRVTQIPLEDLINS